MSKTLLFDFESLSSKEKAAKQVTRYFAQAGAPVVQLEVGNTTRRTAGVSYRELMLTFADSQQITLRIKQSGDIYQVVLNGKLQPIKSQDDHLKAIAELAQAMDKGRSKFQQLLVAAKPTLPKGIRTAAPTLEQRLTEKRDALQTAVSEARTRLDPLKGQPA